MYSHLYLIAIIIINGVAAQDDSTLYLPNLTNACLRCICNAATACNMSLTCADGYCGMFKISRVYWIDAGRHVLAEDDASRAGAYEDCAVNYNCAREIVKKYIARFGRDCNNDGVTNCEDYSMLNFNGGFQCGSILSRNEAGRLWLARYRTCNP